MKPESKPFTLIDVFLATTISSIILSFVVNQLI